MIDNKYFNMKNKKSTIEKATTPKYDYIDTYDGYCNAVVASKDGKFGYINQHGDEVTPMKYDRAMRLWSGVGIVQLDGKWGMVNRFGVEITPLIYNEIKGELVRMGDKYGLINIVTGKLITPVKYDKVEYWIQLEFFEEKDLARVQLDGKWGCINLSGEEVVPLKYDYLDITQREAPRITAKVDGKWGFVTEDGKEVTAFEYDSVEIFCSNRARVKKNGKYGFINSEGVVVIPLIYDDCEPYFYNNGYVYYIKDRSLWKVRCDGKEKLELYYTDNKGHCFDILIKEIKDDYVYFRLNVETYDEYSNDSITQVFRVKTDESRELQIICESESGSIYTGESSSSKKNYDPPMDVKNPVIKKLINEEIESI